MNFKQIIAIAALALAFGLMGCGGEDSLKLTLPDGNIVEEGSIRVIATIKEQGNPPADGEEVNFSTTVGSFEEYSATVRTAVKSMTVEILGGKAETRIYSFPGEAGAGQVSASYVTINGTTVTGSANITLEGGGRPAGGMLSASCDPQNVSVYADTRERSAMQIRCVVRVKDIHGRPVPSAKISSMIEGGCGLTPIEEDETTDFIFSLTPSCDPIDVEPMTGEPSHLDMGLIHNPRDGLLTMVFYTDGMEGFVDANGDGQYNPGESFAGYDLGEPFVDTNDNNDYDTGEQFIDLDENGQWSPANGGWDEDTKIWTSTKIMFTGRPDEGARTTRFEPSGIDIQNGSSQKLTLYLMDINHNPIAAHEESDIIEFSVEGAQLTVDAVSLKKVMGVKFTPDGAVIASSFDEDRTYEVTLEDQNPDPESTPEAVTLGTTVRWTPAPYFDNYDATQQSEELVNVTGQSD